MALKKYDNNFYVMNIIHSILLLLIYIPIIIINILGCEEWMIGISENIYFGKNIFYLSPISMIIFWIMMFYDWGTRFFSKRSLKLLWFFVFLSTYFFGATIYFFLVYHMKYGLKKEVGK